MAYESPQTTITAQLSAADLSAKQFRFVKITSGGVTFTVLGERSSAGILQNNPTSGLPVSLYGQGSISKVVLGSGGATRGQSLSSNATGEAVVSVTSGHVRNAIALESGSAGDLIAALIFEHGLVP